MNNDINFMTSTSLDELLEEHKKIIHPYKKYEFDDISYTLLLCDINKVLKENNNLKQVLNDIRKIVKGYMPTNQSVCMAMDEIEKIIDKVLGDGTDGNN